MGCIPTPPPPLWCLQIYVFFRFCLLFFFSLFVVVVLLCDGFVFFCFFYDMMMMQMTLMMMTDRNNNNNNNNTAIIIIIGLFDVPPIYSSHYILWLYYLVIYFLMFVYLFFNVCWFVFCTWVRYCSLQTHSVINRKISYTQIWPEGGLSFRTHRLCIFQPVPEKMKLNMLCVGFLVCINVGKYDTDCLLHSIWCFVLAVTSPSQCDDKSVYLMWFNILFKR